MKPGWSVQKHPTWLLMVFAAVSIATSAGWGVIETSEARYAEISREMYMSHDWLHPTLMGIYHYHKPPLTYWITSFGYFLFGINPFGARFFLQISVLVQIAILFRIVKIILQEERVAFLTCIIYASMTLVLVSMRGLTTDCYLNTFVLLSIFTWLKWRSGGNPVWLYATSMGLALGFLTKGPLIAIIPLSVFFGFRSSWSQRAASIHNLLSILTFALIAFSWFGLLISENKDLFSYFIHRQTYDRLVHAEVFSRSKSFFYYLIYLPVLLLPWSGIYIPSLFSRAPGSPIDRVNIFWIGLPLLFFSVASSKLPLYVLPVCAGVAISVASAVQSLRRRYHEWLVLVFFLLQWIVLLLVKWIDTSLSIGPPLTIIAAISIVLLLSARSVTQFTREDRISAYTIISTLSVMVYAAVFMSHNELPVNSTAPMSDWITKNSLGGNKVIIYNALIPSIEFQSGKEVLVINSGDKHLQREVNFQRDDQWKTRLLNAQTQEGCDSLRRILRTPSVLIVKGSFNKADEWIEEYFCNRHTEGKWSIYY